MAHLKTLQVINCNIEQSNRKKSLQLHKAAEI